MFVNDGALAGFGSNNYDPLTCESKSHRVHAQRPTLLRDAVRLEAPKVPGVYGMLDPRGRLVYVGKAKNLRSRLMSYFRPASRDPKAGKIVAQARTILWECAPSEFAALLRELELIRRFRPPFNVQGQPTRRQFKYLCLGRSPAPYCFVHSEVSKKALVVYGPLPGRRRLYDAVRRINDYYQLRDCPQSQSMTFADQPELFPVLEAAGCLRFEIGTCLGPCNAAITRPEYSKAVRAAKSFLDGKTTDPCPICEKA
jgi:excinuclease ABC subunit C